MKHMHPYPAVRRSRRAAIAAALMCALPLVGGVRTPANAQARLIRIATLSTEAAAQVFYAQDLGFFAKAGLDVKIQASQSGAAIAAAVASNAVDIGWTTPVSLAIAHEKHIPFVIVAPAALYRSSAPFSSLFVAAGSPIRKASDLNGKTLAANGLSTITEFGPRAWIDQNGGDSKTVKFVELAFSAMPDALAAGRIDAAEIAEPFLAAGELKNRILANPMDAIAKNFLLGAWFSTAPWAKEHPDLVARFASAMHESAIWVNERRDRAKSDEILAKYVNLPNAVMATMVRARFGERLDASLIQPVVDVTAKYAGFATFPAQELLYVPARGSAR